MSLSLLSSFKLLPLVPASLLGIFACVGLLLGTLQRTSSGRIVYYAVQLALILAFISNWIIYLGVFKAQSIMIFHHGFLLDRLSFSLQQAILLGVFLSFCYARCYNQACGISQHQFYTLGLLATLGMVLLVAAQDIITLYLSVELLSLPTYAMVALRRNQLHCVEAGLKYFVIGSLASGLLLYGLSILFGITRSVAITDIVHQLSQLPHLSQNLLIAVALVFIIAGIIFKLGGAPFHMWIPDVYQGAPSSVTLFIAAAPKLATFGLVIKLLVETLSVLKVQWQPILITLAVLSMAIGNIAAIIQDDVKRMLAYSSIAHVGYMSLGLLCGTPAGYAAALFYMFSYVLMSLGAFGMLTLLHQNGVEVEKLRSLVGLNERHPWLAFCLLLVMFSLAGIPPLLGFMAKLSVLQVLIANHLVWLSVLAIVFAIIGAYYYLRVIKAIYFDRAEVTDKSQAQQSPNVRISSGGLIAISINSLAVLLLGIMPSSLLLWCHWVFNV